MRKNVTNIIVILLALCTLLDDTNVSDLFLDHIVYHKAFSLTSTAFLNSSESDHASVSSTGSGHLKLQTKTRSHKTVQIDEDSPSLETVTTEEEFCTYQTYSDQVETSFNSHVVPSCIYRLCRLLI